MMREYGNPWAHRAKWLYLIFVVVALMSPVLHTVTISFNEHGFGAADYDFTLVYYFDLFRNEEILAALGWTFWLAFVVVVVTLPMGILSAKFYQTTRWKVPFLLLMLAPLFIPADIMAAALLVYFKTLSRFFSDTFGLEWFDLSMTTAVIGQVLWCLPYVFVVVLVTMARYHAEQTEAARICGATAWRAFWDV